MRTWALLLVFGLATLLCRHAQNPPSTEAVFRLDVREVILDAQVLNKKTRQAVTELKPADFQVYEDNVPQRLTVFSRDKFPLSVVILFDLTDSVRPVLKSLAEGALEALQHLKQEDEVTVMVYAASTQVLQEATTDRVLAAAAIEKASRMESDEAAFFNEGIFRASEQLTKSGNRLGRRVIIWLTDDVPYITSANEMAFRYRMSLKGEMPHSQKEALLELLRTSTVVCSLVKQSDESVAGGAAVIGQPAATNPHAPGAA